MNKKNLSFYKNTAYHMISLIIISVLIVLSSQNSFAEQSKVTMTKEDCQGDLNFIAQFLLTNDAGIKANEWKTYPPAVQSTLEQQHQKIVSALTVQECLEIIKPFLRSIRKGHLYVSEQNNTSAPFLNTSPMHKKEVIFKPLSKVTNYLSIESFAMNVKKELENEINKNLALIQEAPYLIIDVRRNSGGWDSSYEPLLRIMEKANYWMRIPSVYSTAVNIKTYQTLMNSIKDDKEIISGFQQIIKQMQNSKSEWISMSENNQVEILKSIDKEVMASPKHIAIMIDESCISSCEQFILAAQQNFRVTTIGRNTYGAIDASNIRESITPSAKIKIEYSTTFVKRPHGQIIDGVGIEPMIKLPEPRDEHVKDVEIDLIQQLLENDLI